MNYFIYVEKYVYNQLIMIKLGKFILKFLIDFQFKLKIFE